MEYFYREMRRKTGLLMNGNEPEGGKWNYDCDNRKRASPDLLFPRPYRVKPDAITQEVIAVVEGRFADHFGDIEPCWFAVSGFYFIPYYRFTSTVAFLIRSMSAGRLKRHTTVAVSR
jgi:deoxyribodipyrimidine photolyase-like uncharacterized protein